MTSCAATTGGGPTSSTALLTDHYELTGLDAALRSGVAHHRAVFEVFARNLPDGRRYGVVAGMARLVDAVERFRFDLPVIDHLRGRGFLHADTLAWLADYRFRGHIDGYRDGELFFPRSPVLTVESTFGEALILETVLLSVLNHDAAIAAAASRIAVAAGGRTTIEGGARRTHEEAAVAASLAAYVAGIDVTSNLEAGRRYGLPTAGTTMHAFTLAHRSEEEAFRAQVAAFGSAGTFLVDTYDVPEGIRRAVAAAGPGIGAVRIDSGDPLTEVAAARTLLDELGATSCEIVVSGDLDEFRIAALAASPVDRYLIGTRLVTGSGAPTAELVYKLVAVADEPGPDAPMRPVAKTSHGKTDRGGRKVATRVLGPDGRATAERVRTASEAPRTAVEEGRPLQVRHVEHGEPLAAPGPDEARAHHARALAELDPAHLALTHGEPAFVATSASQG